jgi:4-carboxymuconolactone decarboxylase
MSMRDPAERTAVGAAMQREATGASAPAPATLLEESWRDYIFAEIWTRGGLDRRSRYFISMASAAGTPGPHAALDGYIRGALSNGEATLCELREAALHLAVYSGWSRGGALDAAVTRVQEELCLPQAALDPIRGAPWDAQARLKEGAQAFCDVMTFGGPPPLTPYFEAGILNFVFGEMWKRPALDQRARRWITVVGVCDSGAETPIRSHIHAALASKDCTPSEMHEFVLQYAVHSGWPRASFAQGVVFEMIKKVEAGLGYDG